jgi:NAD(P)-dependent dehydrogenase (short-subunit alcohol dehydrogenase family)
MDLQLRGKRALVTGSSRGIGAAIAQQLAREGAVVVVHGRNEARAEQVAQDIKAEGGSAYVCLGDLATDQGAALVAEKALGLLGGVDILINNAGEYEPRGWMDTLPADWVAIYNNNVISGVRMTRFFLPQMKKLGWGRLIQISSGLAAQPYANMPDYSATKVALLNFTVSLAKETAGTGITVNSVSPGLIVTARVMEIFQGMAPHLGWPDDWAEIERRILQEVLPNPTGRLGRPEDVACLVAFLASPLAGYINGANFRVDGGSTVTIN